MNGIDKNNSILQSCIGRAQDLAGIVQYADDAIVSKTVLDKPTGTITVFSFDKGQRLSEHTVPFDAVVQVVDGIAAVSIDGQENTVSAGQIIIMPANVPHSVHAKERFKMLLVMIRK